MTERLGSFLNEDFAPSVAASLEVSAVHDVRGFAEMSMLTRASRSRCLVARAVRPRRTWLYEAGADGTSFVASVENLSATRRVNLFTLW
jgi:hypothetical protein